MRPWAPAWTRRFNAIQHQRQPHSLTPLLGWVWEDQYWINTLWIIWQVFSTLCAPTCALYLDYWLSGCPQELTCSGGIQWHLGLWTQALVSLAIALLSPHLSLHMISVCPLVKFFPECHRVIPVAFQMKSFLFDCKWAFTVYVGGIDFWLLSQKWDRPAFSVSLHLPSDFRYQIEPVEE